MLSAGDLFLFVAASAVLILTPGPDILYVLTRSLAQGTRCGLAAALGMTSGLVVHTAFASAGLASVFARSEGLLRAVQYAGAAYLFYLAWQMLRAPLVVDLPGSTPANGAQGMWRVYRQSVAMNLLNPKVALFFLAFLPQFVRPGQNESLQFLLLGAIFMVLTAIGFSLVALIAGRIGGWLRGSIQGALWMQRCAALVFIGLGLRLILRDTG